MEQIVEFDVGMELPFLFEELQKVWNETKHLSEAGYYSLIAMLVEERCKQYGGKVVYVFEKLAKTAQEINDTIGEY